MNRCFTLFYCARIWQTPATPLNNPKKKRLLIDLQLVAWYRFKLRWSKVIRAPETRGNNVFEEVLSQEQLQDHVLDIKFQSSCQIDVSSQIWVKLFSILVRVGHDVNHLWSQLVDSWVLNSKSSPKNGVRYLKWRNPHLYKLYVMLVGKRKPTHKIVTSGSVYLHVTGTWNFGWKALKITSVSWYGFLWQENCPFVLQILRSILVFS